MNVPILKVEHLCKDFYIGRHVLQAVNDVSFEVLPGETVGLVGESGSGKTTLGRTVIRLQKPTSGKIIFKDTDITNMSNKQLKPLRRNMQMIFQNPYGSLDPRSTVGSIIAEPLKIHHVHPAKAREEQVQQLLQMVGLKPDHIRRYAHELSGGQRQRVSLARAIALAPEFLICDEPTSALDVSIQVQITNLLMDLQASLGVAYLFISHDLALVKYISHKVAVMYNGHIVEFGPTADIYEKPFHPYTQMLIANAMDTDKKQEAVNPTAQVPTDGERVFTGKGCRFANKCKYAEKICLNESPPLIEIDHRKVACHMIQKSQNHPPQDNT